MGVRDETAETPSETDARSREGGRHTWHSMLTDRAASPPAVRLVAAAYRRLE